MIRRLRRTSAPQTPAASEPDFESQSTPLVIEDFDYGHGIKISKPLGLAKPFKFDAFFRTVRSHAFKDQGSQSLDRFLIEGDGLELEGNYQTPFQESLPNRVELLKNELLMNEHEIALKAAVQLHELEMKYRSADEQVQNISARMAQTKEDLAVQEQILKGVTPGRGGISRPGQLLAAGSPFSDFFRIHSGFFTLLLIGLVDAGVLVISLATILGASLEGLFFSIPAIGIQVLFPHLIGEKLALILGSSAKRKSEALFMTLLIFLWGGFVAILSIIRGNFIAQQMIAKALKEQTDSGIAADQNVVQLEILTLQLFIPVILAGLGIWLIFHAYRSNPHELEYLKLKNSQLRKSRELKNAETVRANFSERLKIQKAALDTLKDLNQSHLGVMDDLYAEAGNQVYERVLVNVFGNPDFTTQITKQNKPLRNKV